MQTIYKYELDETIELPVLAKIIRVDYDFNLQLCLWAIVDTDKPQEARHFEMFATGQAIKPLDSDHFRTYIGTIHDPQDMMWHVFEVKAKKEGVGAYSYDEDNKKVDLDKWLKSAQQAPLTFILSPEFQQKVNRAAGGSLV